MQIFKVIMENFAKIKTALEKLADHKCINLIQGEYTPLEIMTGINSNGEIIEYGKPVLEFERLSMEGVPIHLYFKIEEQKVQMHFKFTVKTSVSGSMPLYLRDLEIKLNLSGTDIPSSTLSLYNSKLDSGERPQVVSGTWTWDNVHEFIGVKKALLSGNATIVWNGKVQFVNICQQASAQHGAAETQEQPRVLRGPELRKPTVLPTRRTGYPQPEIQERIKEENYRLEPQTALVSGEIPICVSSSSNDNSYKVMFGDVNNLLCWDSEILDGHTVYFKDPFKDDIIYFLPQEYRIMALESNAPDITTEIVKSGDTQKILTRIKIAPYVHPNAKRDVYRIFFNRKGKKYCDLKYGGYDSAQFKWGGEMPDGKLYGDNGFTDININNTEINASPDSCFTIVLETPRDELAKLFQEKILGEGIHIGDVYFTVHDDIDGENKKELGPIPVKLDLHKLAGIHPEVKIDSCSRPDYEATITNRGSYPIEIGGLAMSLLSGTSDAVHDLKIQSNLPIPALLEQNSCMHVRVTQEQVENLPRGFTWNKLLCEPYSIRLRDEDLKGALTKINESAAYVHEEWILLLETSVDWVKRQEITALQVGLRNKFGLNEIVTLTSDQVKKNISMTPNLGASLNTKLESNRIFEYRFRYFTTDGPKEPDWTAWLTCSSNYLLIRDNDLNEPTVHEEATDVKENRNNGADSIPESGDDLKDLKLSFWMSWTKDVEQVIVDVFYDDEKNDIHNTIKNVQLDRNDAEAKTITLRVKDPKIKPQIIVTYKPKNKDKMTTMSDLTVVDNPMVNLPSAAPQFKGDSPNRKEALKRIGKHEPNKLLMFIKKLLMLIKIVLNGIGKAIRWLIDLIGNNGPKVVRIVLKVILAIVAIFIFLWLCQNEEFVESILNAPK